MKFDLGLHRDQRRLAAAKLASLPEGNPLRERYNSWISRLDAIIAGSLGAPTHNPPPEPAVAASAVDCDPDMPASRTEIPVVRAEKMVGERPIGSIRREVSQRAAMTSALRNGPLLNGEILDTNKLPTESSREQAVLRDRLILENSLLKSMLERFA